MTMLEQMDADWAAAENELPFEFTFNGKPCVGSQAPSMDGQVFVDAGIIPKSEFQLLVRKAQFLLVPPPVQNDEFVSRPAGIVYRVESINASPDGLGFTCRMVLRT